MSSNIGHGSPLGWTQGFHHAFMHTVLSTKVRSVSNFNKFVQKRDQWKSDGRCTFRSYALEFNHSGISWICIPPKQLEKPFLRSWFWANWLKLDLLLTTCAVSSPLSPIFERESLSLRKLNLASGNVTRVPFNGCSFKIGNFGQISFILSIRCSLSRQ